MQQNQYTPDFDRFKEEHPEIEPTVFEEGVIWCC